MCEREKDTDRETDRQRVRRKQLQQSNKKKYRRVKMVYLFCSFFQSFLLFFKSSCIYSFFLLSLSLYLLFSFTLFTFLSLFSFLLLFSLSLSWSFYVSFSTCFTLSLFSSSFPLFYIFRKKKQLCNYIIKCFIPWAWNVLRHLKNIKSIDFR